MTTIDLRQDTWRDKDPAARAREWLNTVSVDDLTVAENLGLDDTFCYDEPGYETTILGLIMAACGTSNLPALFRLPDGLAGDLDLIAGNMEGVIDYVRYVLYVPHHNSVFRSACLGSPLTELDDTMDDRGLAGIDAAVDVLVHAATQFAILQWVYESIDFHIQEN